MRRDTGIAAERIEYLRRGGVVITANARAARALERDFAHAQQRVGHRAWPAPNIVTWQVWLAQLWQQHLFTSTESRLLLNTVQERSVWTALVAKDPRVQQVLSPDALASLAQEAYALLAEYGAHESRNSSWASHHAEDERSDAEAFRSWARAFDGECRANNWLSESRLAEELGPRIRSGKVMVAREIRTLGFDRLTPSQQHLLDAAKESGWDVVVYDRSLSEKKCELRPAKDRDTEIHDCARWLRERLLANPEEKLAVIVTNPRELRGELERVFRRVLMPSSMYLATPRAITEANRAAKSDDPQYGAATVTESEPCPAFEFSLGAPLASLPVIQAALLLLRWLAYPLRQEEVTWLLLSGFLTQAEEFAMAQLDARLRARSLLPPEIELGAFLKQREHAKTAAAGRLFQQLDTFAGMAIKNGIPQRERSAMDWADDVPGMLSAAGWPGSQPQGSLRFQALDKWEQLLAELATLNFDGARISYRDFLKVLERQASETIFAAQSLDAPVQIIGALESSGQSFDAIWFMGAEENAWPLPGDPNPLIPMAIQRKFEMPHATAELDWKLAHIATERIASSAPECVFSYAQQDRDGELRISPLMREIFGTQANRFAMEPPAAWHESEIVAVAIEEVDEGAAIPWPLDKVAGGAAVLASQSACAFQAFAGKRLRTEKLDCAEWGLTALVRGELTHQVLESLWCGKDGLASLDGLQTAMAENELEPLLTQKIAEVFAGHAATRATEGWIRSYIETEKIRFKERLSAWLKEESGRKAFSVESCEKEIPDLRVGDLRLSVRVDRIDRLDNGRRLLIDYKTGEVSVKKWECPRPEDPQLPLYATFGDLGEISGLLFAQIRAGGNEFKGQLSEPQDLMAQNSKSKGRIKLTEKDLDTWRSELLRLADDFLRGEAAVAPKNYPKTCTYCGLQPLCRVADTNVPLKASDIDAPDDFGQADNE